MARPFLSGFRCVGGSRDSLLPTLELWSSRRARVQPELICREPRQRPRHSPNPANDSTLPRSIAPPKPFRSWMPRSNPRRAMPSRDRRRNVAPVVLRASTITIYAPRQHAHVPAKTATGWWRGRYRRLDCSAGSSATRNNVVVVCIEPIQPDIFVRPSKMNRGLSNQVGKPGCMPMTNNDGFFFEQPFFGILPKGFQHACNVIRCLAVHTTDSS